MNPRLGLTILAGLSLVAFAAACGGDEESDSSTIATPDGAGVITITARDVKFVPDRITVSAGEMVELRLENEDGQEHDLQVKDLDVEIMEGGATGAEHQTDTPETDMEMETPEHGMQADTPKSGESASANEIGTIALHTTANGEESISFIATQKGTYEFWCTITGHKEAGMVGTLTVE